jgi:hypothetical protein
MDRNARNITREFVEVLNAVILDEALGQNADRLRNVDKRRVRLRRDRSTVGIDARRSGACVLRIGGKLRSRLCPATGAGCGAAGRRNPGAIRSTMRLALVFSLRRISTRRR